MMNQESVISKIRGRHNRNIILLCIIFVVLGTGGLFAAVTTDGLVWYMDAATPGYNPNDVWKPVIGAMGSGTIHDIGGMGFAPELTSESANDPCDPNLKHWFYRLTSDYLPGVVTDAYGGRIAMDGLHETLKMDYNDDFTYEFWTRPGWPECITDPNGCGFFPIWTAGYMYLGGHQYANNGIQIYQRVYNGKLYTTAWMRDRSGTIQTVYQAINLANHPFGQWYHIVVTYDGNDLQDPCMLTWTDGVEDTNKKLGARSDFNDTDFGYGVYDSSAEGSVGAAIQGAEENTVIGHRKFFEGDISVVRIYNKTLTAEEIQANYQAGMTKATAIPACTSIPAGDINKDCVVNEYDLLVVASNWLECNWDPSSECLN